jgi:hypothetical protein
MASSQPVTTVRDRRSMDLDISYCSSVKAMTDSGMATFLSWAYGVLAVVFVLVLIRNAGFVTGYELGRRTGHIEGRIAEKAGVPYRYPDA